jgi:alpha-1,6-mannosyltransferase
MALGIFLLLNVATGLDFGWVNSLGTPGKVRTWLSPMTGLGMLTGNGADLLGLGYRVDGAVDFWRAVGTLLTVAIIGWLVLTGDRRSPARGLALALLALVMLGPVVQPWYLLWALIALAASGLTSGQTRVAVLATTGFVVYSLANSGSTVPTYVFLSDGIAAMVSVAIVVGLLASSKRARAILLEDARPPAEIVLS